MSFGREHKDSLSSLLVIEIFQRLFDSRIVLRTLIAFTGCRSHMDSNPKSVPLWLLRKT